MLVSVWPLGSPWSRPRGICVSALSRLGGHKHHAQTLRQISRIHLPPAVFFAFLARNVIIRFEFALDSHLGLAILPSPLADGNCLPFGFLCKKPCRRFILPLSFLIAFRKFLHKFTIGTRSSYSCLCNGAARQYESNPALGHLFAFTLILFALLRMKGEETICVFKDRL